MKLIAKEYIFNQGGIHSAGQLIQAKETLEPYLEMYPISLNDHAKGLILIFQTFKINEEGHIDITKEWLEQHLDNPDIECMIEDGDLEPILDKWEQVLQDIEEMEGIRNYVTNLEHAKYHIQNISDAIDWLSGIIVQRIPSQEAKEMIDFLNILFQSITSNVNLSKGIDRANDKLDLKISI